MMGQGSASNERSACSRREFLKAAGAVGATGMLGQSAFGAGKETGLAESKSESAKPGRYARSVLPKDASKTRREIQEFVDEMLIMDTHEHLRREEDYLAEQKGRPDFSLLFSHYTKNDLINAGMSAVDYDSFRSSETPPDRKWELFEPHWQRMRTTGYGWVKELAIRNLYGIEDLSRETYADLTKRMQAAYKPGVYYRFLREAAGIDRGVVDLNDDNVDRALFVPALRVDHYILVWGKAGLATFDKLAGGPVTSVKTISDLMQGLIVQWQKKNVPAAKCAMAYSRTLQVQNVSDQDGQRALDALLSKDDLDSVKLMQDYIFHLVLRACSDHGMPLQIHTGILSGPNTTLERTNPLGLHDVLSRYANAKVDLFHAGYPWVSEMACIGKVNVCAHADLAWAHAVSPSAARKALDEWLDAMPASKILAFGGDYKIPEGSYGHSVIARTNVGEVLAARVERGRMTMSQAKAAARMILRDNARRLFDIS